MFKQRSNRRCCTESEQDPGRAWFKQIKERRSRGRNDNFDAEEKKE